MCKKSVWYGFNPLTTHVYDVAYVLTIKLHYVNVQYSRVFGYLSIWVRLRIRKINIKSVWFLVHSSGCKIIVLLVVIINVHFEKRQNNIQK